MLTEARVRDGPGLAIQIILLAQVFVAEYLVGFTDLCSDNAGNKLVSATRTKREREWDLQRRSPKSRRTAGSRTGFAAITYRLEFGMCTLVARILIGMVLDSELTISLLDLELGGSRLDSQGIVVFCFFDHLMEVVRWLMWRTGEAGGEVRDVCRHRSRRRRNIL